VKVVDGNLNNKIKEKRRSKVHTNTDIIMKKKGEISSNPNEETTGIVNNKTCEDLPDPIPFKKLASPKEEEQKTESSTNLLYKKKINLKVISTKIPFDPMSEIKSSDNKNDINKTKTLENIINDHLYRCLIFSPIATESIFKRHLTLTYRGLIYAKKCLKEPSKTFLKTKLVNLVDSKRTFFSF